MIRAIASHSIELATSLLGQTRTKADSLVIAKRHADGRQSPLQTIRVDRRDVNLWDCFDMHPHIDDLSLVAPQPHRGDSNLVYSPWTTT